MALLNTDPGSAIALQRELAGKVCLTDDFTRPPETVAGVDVAFPEGGRISRAAAVVVEFPRLETIATAACEIPTPFPYIPGLLSFRELPGILRALDELPVTPDVILCDGQGIAHPRRFGIACHLGVETGLPTLGVGKSRLCGHHVEPGPEKGDRVNLTDDEDVIGQVVRTRTRVRPVYVSPGHRISLEAAVTLALACTHRLRLPVPVHLADRLSKDRSGIPAQGSCPPRVRP